MNMNYNANFEELLFAAKKAIKKNKREQPPFGMTIDTYVLSIKEMLSQGLFFADQPKQIKLYFQNKILNIDICSLKNRILEYYFENKIVRINDKYWYDNREFIFRKGSGKRSFQVSALKNRKDFRYTFVTDLKDAYNIDYYKLKNNILKIHFDKTEVKLIEKLLFANKNRTIGLPLGHKLSNTLFDCYLIPLENTFFKSRVKFLRFIDSFVFFLQNKTEIDKILEIFNIYKIKININKTKMLDNYSIDVSLFSNEIIV